MTSTAAPLTPDNTTSAGGGGGGGGEEQTMTDQKLAVICILSVLSVFGTVGNGLVLYVFSSKGNKVTSTIFILALAWTDTFTCSVIIPLTIAFTAREADMGFDFLCKFYTFLITFNVPLAAFIMVAIAVDRYFSICHPFLHAVTPRRARITVVILCTFTFLLGSIPAIGCGYKFRPFAVALNETAFGEESTERTTSAVEETTTTTPTTREAGGLITTEAFTSGVDEPLEGSWACEPPGEYLSMEFIQHYQKFYASLFLLAVIAVFIIYALIYRSVVRRREWRRRQRSNRPPGKSPVSVTVAAETEEMEMSTRNGNASAVNGGNGSGGGGENGCNETQLLNSTDKKASKERRDFNFLANIRTAAMLFVVTLVFIVSFLPAWLMAVNVVTFHVVVFYLYFIYNVANPVIYAFMNHAFRKELKRVFQRGLNLCRV
ncbi:uncharacterized protein LOC143287241 [Babylonia areolata]|uniref:uncharacterized protein LOC143287241 n=1 Tax=Babylonia areolata TaxID=304850 RepID=UPI003FD3BA66